MGEGHSGKILNKRGPFQGVANIIRFNWTFYLLSLITVLACVVVIKIFPSSLLVLATLGGCITLLTVTSLLVSFYIYDYSDLYSFGWMEEINSNRIKWIYNFSAGFDESSAAIGKWFPQAKLIAFDFYSEDLMGEPSIERARKRYPPSLDRIIVDPLNLKQKSNSADLIFLIFSAHELRNRTHRLEFFKQLKKLLKNNGELYLMEHLRDIPNFLAYSVGFLHFYSGRNWETLLQEAGFEVLWEKKHTPFISVFKLVSNE